MRTPSPGFPAHKGKLKILPDGLPTHFGCEREMMKTASDSISHHQTRKKRRKNKMLVSYDTISVTTSACI